MIDRDGPDLAPFAGIIEDNVAHVVEELRAIELVDLISFIRFESFPTVEDLVNAATELFFEPEMLTFAWAACADLRWDALPVVTLGLEFRHPSVTVFFNLTLRNAEHEVEVLGITFEAPHAASRDTLALAFDEARRPGTSSPLRLVPSPRGRRRGLSWS